MISLTLAFGNLAAMALAQAAGKSFGGDFLFDLDDRAVLFDVRLVFAALLGKFDVEHDCAVFGLLFDALKL